MDFVLTQHAKDVILRRAISMEWIQQAIQQGKVERDQVDEKLEHRLIRIQGYDNRVLRVIIDPGSKPIKIISAYFDRTMKKKL